MRTADAARRIAGAELPEWVTAVGVAPMEDAEGAPALAVYIVVTSSKTDFKGREVYGVQRVVREALQDVPQWPYVRFVDDRDVMIPGTEVVDAA